MARASKVAFIVDQQFEDAEFRVPFEGTSLQGKKGREKINTEKSIRDVSVDDFAALVIPGGYSPDHLRQDPQMVSFTRDFLASGKPLAAVCHAGWMLAGADVLDGRTVTSWPSIKTDLINAGARWVDRELVEDGNLITSRKPDDLPAFSDAIVRQLEGMLESALAVPKATMFGELLHPTSCEQAAAYLFYLVKNRPFVDGNKRVGLGAALTFLGLNGLWIKTTNEALVQLTLDVVEGRVSKSETAVFLQKHAEAWE